jgi:hypothetical protein
VLAELVDAGWTDAAMPTFTTIRDWLIRLGLYALTRPLARTQKWVWLLDHTIQIGTTKLLIILGCPQSQLPFGTRALTRADLTLIACVPMDHSTGDRVEEELQRAALRTGRPVQIASDQGSDLLKGIQQYRELRPDIAFVPDIAHVGANLLEQAWKADPRWSEFTEQLQTTALKLRQTKSAHLLAPRLRVKARYMNVGTLLRFADRVLRLLDSGSESASKYYGWLSGFRDELSVWLREHGLVQMTIAKLRVSGLHAGVLPELESAWGEIGTHARTVRIAEGLRAYVRRYQPSSAGVTRVASTEIVESCIGKLKYLEGDQSSSGVTELSLALGALVGSWSESEIGEALDAVPQKKVSGWLERNLGPTVQWLRRQFLGGKSVPDRG